MGFDSLDLDTQIFQCFLLPAGIYCSTRCHLSGQIRGPGPKRMQHPIRTLAPVNTLRRDVRDGPWKHNKLRRLAYRAKLV